VVTGRAFGSGASRAQPEPHAVTKSHPRRWTPIEASYDHKPGLIDLKGANLRLMEEVEVVKAAQLDAELAHLRVVDAAARA
jgi:hypothetical protein